jgi:flagellar biosynthesis/type III secretory pathway M-ring protein FliF/YscJ
MREIRLKLRLLSRIAFLLLILSGCNFWPFAAYVEVGRFNESQVAAIAQELDRIGYPYRIEEEGRRILVPAEIRNEVLLSLSGTGLLRMNVTSAQLYSLEEMDLKTVKAMKTELSGIMRTNPIVKDFRISFGRTEPVSDSDTIGGVTTAIAVITLRDGATPSDSQIETFRNLIRGTFPPLTDSNLTLTDQFGNILRTDSRQRTGSHS